MVQFKNDATIRSLRFRLGGSEATLRPGAVRSCENRPENSVVPTLLPYMPNTTGAGVLLDLLRGGLRIAMTCIRKMKRNQEADADA